MEIEGSRSTPTVRRAARLVLLDDTDRVLLARFGHGKRSWWVVPGGGLEDGQTHAEAARMEIAEKTGRQLGRLGSPVWVREDVFRFEGRAYRQLERYFVARVPAFEPAPNGPGEREAAGAFAGLRWWTLAELEACEEEEFVPADLAALLRSLVEDGRPERPIEIGA